MTGERKPFVPLIYRPNRVWQRVLVLLVAIALIVGWTLGWADKGHAQTVSSAQDQCGPGYTAVFSKYSGYTCHRDDQGESALLFAIRCGGDTLIGYIFGGGKGAAGGGAACTFHTIVG